MGFIRISYWHLKNDKDDRLVRNLTLRGRDNDTDSPMANMNDVTLKELRGDCLLFTRKETVNRQHYRQAWLCRLLTDDEKRALKGS